VAKREAVQESEQTQNLPAVQQSGGFQISPDLADLAREDAGLGVSRRAEDNLIPMISVLQPMSPVVNRQHPSYVDGAEPGAFYLKNSPIPIIPGSEGFEFIPAAMELAWVEWRPRAQGGGWVAKHPEPPKDLMEIVDASTGAKKRIRRETRNEMIETRYRYGLAVLPGFGPLPFVLPFFGTGHTVCKAWETQMNSLLVPGTADPYPSFIAAYRLTTRQRTNQQGTWYQVEPKLSRNTQAVEYHRAKAMLRAFEASQISVDSSQMEDVQGVDDRVPF
jgi:hypothetical protein